MDYPTVNVVSNENETIVLDIEWQNSIKLNDELRSYEFYLNNQSIYAGKSTNLVYKLNASLFDCLSDNLGNFSKNYKNAGYFMIQIVLQVRTAKSKLTTPPLKIPFNCTCKTIIILKKIIGVVLF
jgi:hypothetical protein